MYAEDTIIPACLKEGQNRYRVEDAGVSSLATILCVLYDILYNLFLPLEADYFIS